MRHPVPGQRAADENCSTAGTRPEDGLVGCHSLRVFRMDGDSDQAEEQAGNEVQELNDGVQQQDMVPDIGVGPERWPIGPDCCCCEALDHELHHGPGSWRKWASLVPDCPLGTDISPGSAWDGAHLMGTRMVLLTDRIGTMMGPVGADPLLVPSQRSVQ